MKKLLPIFVTLLTLFAPSEAWAQDVNNQGGTGQIDQGGEGQTTYYTLIFHPNCDKGYSGMTFPIIQEAGSTCTIPDCGFKRSNYVFIGWAESEDGDVKYQPGDNYTLTANLTFYAKWRHLSTVTFNANGGTGEMESVTLDYESPYIIPECVFFNRDLRFVGWAESANGSVVYQPGDNITLTDNLTLYAKWINKFTFDGLNYKITDHDLLTVELTGYEGDKPTGVLNIPASVRIGEKDYSVTSISETAFIGITSITSVIISDGITTIGKDAFTGCTNLQSVILGSGVTSIENIFNLCPYLESFTVNDNNMNYKSLDGVLFNKAGTTLVKYPRAKSGKSYTIPDGVTSIGDNAFEYNRFLTSIIIGNNVTSIGNYAFYNTGLTSVTIPSSVTSFGERAFQECASLSSLTLTEGLTTIGNHAFKITGLTSVTIPSSVTTIGDDTFSSCTSLSSVTLPEGLTTIGNYVFFNTGLTSVTIPSSVTTIGIAAFSKCTSLSSVTIPSSVTTIGSSAFSNSGLKSVMIPSSVTTIGGNAFRSTGLKSVTIPSSVTTIDISAFYDCSSLSSVTIYAPSLTTYGGDAFYNNASERKIYVFSDCVDTYKAGWSSYVDDIKPIPDLTANDAGGELGRWCTYYNGLADVTVDEKTTVYTAAVNGSDQVALTPTGSRIVKRGEAVLLNSTVGNITLSSAASSGDGDYTGNELKGVDYETAQAEGTTYYVLSKKEDIFGFYKLAEGVKLGVNKAYLAESSSSRDFFGLEEETTSLTPVPSPIGEGSDRWYTLQGHKIANSQKPKAKGIYIHNGRKEVLK